MIDGKTITIGIDSSTVCCGVAIYKSGVFFKTEKLEFKDRFCPEKLYAIAKEFQSLFIIYQPDIVVIEEPVPTRFSKAVTSLNQVAGVIFGVATYFCDTVDFIHNLTVKKAMGIKTKEDSIAKAKSLYPQLKDINDDQSDAIMLVETYNKIFADFGVYN